MTTEMFLNGVVELANRFLLYKQGKSGEGGLCDCIGLVRHGVEAAGEKWDGIHGSNWCARYGLKGKVKAINTEATLQRGDIVFKAREKGNILYKLPDRYKQGGQYNDGDLNDYYHVGVVTGVNPLEITHMTTPTVARDKKLGKWAWVGTLKWIEDAMPVTYASGYEKVEETTTGGTKVTEKVTVGGGNVNQPINIRAAGSTKAQIVTRAPQGATVELVSWGSAWCEIIYNGVHGFIMTQFVNSTGADVTTSATASDTITITMTVSDAQELLQILEGMKQPGMSNAAGRVIDELVAKVGRG